MNAANGVDARDTGHSLDAGSSEPSGLAREGTRLAGIAALAKWSPCAAFLHMVPALAGTEFNQAVRRLAQYRPFDEGGRDIRAAVRDLVLGAAAVEGGGFSSLAAAQAGISALWGMDVEIDELREVVDGLEQDARVDRRSGGFRLTDEAQAELEAVAAESERVMQQAFVDWGRTVREQRPDMTDAEFALLTEDLQTWLGQVISRHGVESALILYPENPRAQQLFDAIEALGLNFLPERTGCIQEVREWALQVFVRDPTGAQRTYLAGLLNTAFHMTVLTLDSEASQLVQERVAGHRVYLDTNVIYALLGLAGSATETLSAARVIELTRSLGYDLAVTQWTLDELRSSLKAAERRLQRVPLPRQDLAKLMTLKAGESQITRAYWMRYGQTGIRPKDFFEYYSHVETVLEDSAVSVITEGCLAVDRNREAIDRQLVVLDRIIGHLDKEEVVKEHDVKHRLLVERLRGDGNISFSNARYWFLTRDSKLPRYAMATFDGEPVKLPFCAATAAWVQVMRAFTPRTEDFDKSLVDLFSTPYLRYGRGPGVNPKVVDAVVGRLDVYEGATPKLAAEVLADTALVDDIATARDEAEEVQKVENALIAKSEELRDRAEASELREAALRAQRDAAEGLAREAAEKSEEVGARLAASEQSAEEQRVLREQAADRARRLDEERRRIADAECARAAEVQQARAEADRERQLRQARERDTETARRDQAKAERRLEVMSGLVLAAVGLALVAVSLVVLKASAPLLCALLSVAALLECVSIRLVLGKKHGGTALQLLFGFSGIIGLIVSVVVAVAAK